MRHLYRYATHRPALHLGPNGDGVVLSNLKETGLQVLHPKTLNPVDEGRFFVELDGDHFLARIPGTEAFTHLIAFIDGEPSVTSADSLRPRLSSILPGRTIGDSLAFSVENVHGKRRLFLVPKELNSDPGQVSPGRTDPILLDNNGTLSMHGANDARRLQLGTGLLYGQNQKFCFPVVSTSGDASEPRADYQRIVVMNVEGQEVPVGLTSSQSAVLSNRDGTPADILNPKTGAVVSTVEVLPLKNPSSVLTPSSPGYSSDYPTPHDPTRWV